MLGRLDFILIEFKKTSVKVQFFFFFFYHSHVEKGKNKRKGRACWSSCLSGTGIRVKFYLFYFLLSRPAVVFAVECQSWLNVARLLGKVHAWSTQVSSLNPNDCVTSFQPSQAMSLVCMWFFLFVVLIASLACILVSLPTGSCVGGIKKRITNGTSSRRTEKKTTCVLLFFLLWPRTMNNFKLYGYSCILLCEIKYRYCGLWWMERVSQLSVTSTLKTFPKWPYKEFLKRCLQNKRSNWWKTESILNLNFTPFFISISAVIFLKLCFDIRDVNTAVAKYRQQR